jgi:DNA-binding response OmpR family regulator/EAL domain-containing protein (putative c-di-GMP-specific phosphodiesterase class I)
MDDRSPPASLRRLTAQARELAMRGLALVDAWPVVEVAQLYEQVDNLAAAADLPGAEAIASAALETAVYLSSLVEAGNAANPAQRERARSLMQALAQAAGLDAETGVVAASPAPVRASQHRVVFYLRADDRELGGLVQQLASERFVTRSFSDLNRALAETRTMTPHALVVDEGFIPGIARMIEAVERAGGDQRRRPLVLALCAGSDVRQRLYAQRAGADAVLEAADSVQTVERLMGLFLRQSREDARVLIIDDDASMALFCANVLNYKGIASRIENTARDGLAAIGEYRPDLVLLDLYLPDMNGIEVAQLVRERPDMMLTPIVFMSGEEDMDKRFDAIRMGGDDFLAKPLKPRHLLAAVTGRLGRARKQAATASPAGPGPDLRSGRIDRATLVHEIERARRGELGDCVGLIMLSVDEVPALAKRLGFVRTGDLAQQIGTIIASEPALKTGVCALGEFSFMALLSVSSEGALYIAAENLRARLSGRGWLSADAAVRVGFSLAGARADEPGVAIDDLFAGASEAMRKAQQDGGGRSEWVARQRDDSQITPEVRLAHAILRRPLIAETTHFRFRALAQLRGQLASQYLADFALVPPKATHAMRIERSLYMPIAQSLNAMRAVDRWQIHALAQRLRHESAAHPELRILLPASVDTLFDPSFPQWLATDLHGLQCDPDALALVFDVAQLLDDLPRASRALENIQTTGVRLCLTNFSDFGRDQQRLCRTPGSYANLIDWQRSNVRDWPEVRARLVAESLKHGKLVVMSGIDDPGPLGLLFRDGVHYVLGDALGHWSERLGASPVAIRA